MASIYFVGPYKPIMCGIGDYVSFLTQASPYEKWGVLSFDLEKYGARLIGNEVEEKDHVWYGIPNRSAVSAQTIVDGLEQLGARKEEAVLWFQHEFGIWQNSRNFVDLLRNLHLPKIVSFHTLHFQSLETRTGLRKNEYEFLQALLPYVDAITVFSHGVYRAVTAAFPEYSGKVFVMKHGIHSYPEISCLSRKEAKKRLNDFLLYESTLSQETKEILINQGTFLDPDAIILGQTGFLSPFKGTMLLYAFKDELQKTIPHKRIVAVRIGSPVNEFETNYAEQLRSQHNGRDKLLLEIWLPPSILPLAQRAMDIYFYWPEDCTQSGVMAHALGAGAIVACRDLEGVGETLKDAGELVDTNMENLLKKSRTLIFNQEITDQIEETVLAYANEFSWEKQAQRHFELAEHFVAGSVPASLAHALTIPDINSQNRKMPVKI